MAQFEFCTGVFKYLSKFYAIRTQEIEAATGCFHRWLLSVGCALLACIRVSYEEVHCPQSPVNATREGRSGACDSRP